ncbi:MAG: ShlB/FhaC/HecB family hemolysin secretion/activation protein [Methylotenera sp.]|nr:ShlB/FhaC/HecB family hemolysin secretion/activation protein [Methylotenera sp.]
MTLSQAAPLLPDPANIPRAEPVAPLPSIKPIEIKPGAKPAYRAPTSDKEIKLFILKFIFSGNRAFTDEQLSALLQDKTNREIGLKDLNEATKTVTDYYRKHGYFLAQAYLPAQDVNESTVEIAVLEGHLGKLTLNMNGPELNVAKLNADFLKEMAAYHLKSDDSINDNNLVRNITLLNSLPALRANAQLNPGDEIGSTDVEIEIKPMSLWQAYVAGNTYGNRFTGREVAIAGLKLNNLAGIGDQLNLSFKRSNDEGQRGLQLAYYTPVHASGTLLNLGYNYVDYKLGGAFKALGASGESQYFNVNLDQPLIRNAQQGLTARLGGTYKIINDEVSTFALNNRRNIAGVDLGIFSDWSNNGGDVSNQLGFNLHAGHVNFKDNLAQLLDETGTKTAGDFVKYNVVASQVHYLKNGVSIALRADYQGTNKNLDSVEKIAIGGINRWRAFAELPSLADSGWVAGVEIRKIITANKSLENLLLEIVSPYAFVDAGRGKINQNALSSDNHVKSIHYGIGIDAALKNKWSLSVTASHQTRDFDGASTENETRAWAQLQKEF